MKGSRVFFVIACAGFILVLAALMPAIGAEAGKGGEVNWPDWRGPSSDGRSDATGLPLNWSETENIAWKIPIHDSGHSTPVVWGDQVWLTTAKERGEALYAVCVDLNTGKVVHDVEVFSPERPQRINKQNTYATPSAVIEEGRVYVHYGTFGTACLDTETGDVLWRHTDYHTKHMQGPVSSPVLFDNLLIVHLEGTDVFFAAALDKNTGKEVWRADRPPEIYKDAKPTYVRKAYHTPIITEANGNPQLVSNGALVCTGQNPRTGEELWRVFYGGDNTISRPISGQGFFFINSGGATNNVELLAVPHDAAGDITDSGVAWRIKDGVCFESSPVLAGDLLYMVSDKGLLTCLEPTNGETVWSEQLEGNYGASLLYADNRIYACSKQGRIIIIEPGREFKKLAENQIDGELWASPAVTGNSLLFRTKTHLYRVQDK